MGPAAQVGRILPRRVCWVTSRLRRASPLNDSPRTSGVEKEDRGRMRTILLRLLGTWLVVLLPSKAYPQVGTDPSAPREVVDSAYAVRLAVERLTDEIRRGQVDSRVYRDDALAAAIASVHAAAQAAGRPPPHPDLGVLWDLQAVVTDVTVVGPGQLEALARFSLSTDTAAAATAEFGLSRLESRWIVTGVRNLVTYLHTLALRFR